MEKTIMSINASNENYIFLKNLSVSTGLSMSSIFNIFITSIRSDKEVFERVFKYAI